jgi:hypothetical protein
MWQVIHFSLRVLAVIAGLFCLLTASLAYPGEEGQMQTIFEDLWTKIDDRQKAALSLHTGFMQQVAKLLSRGFDLLFGQSLFSVRCLGVSISYSIASTPLALILFTLFAPPFDKQISFSSEDLSVLTIFGCISIGYLFIGTIPVLFPNFRFIKTWLLFILASACVLWVLGFARPALSLSQMLTNLASEGLLAIGAGFGSDVLFIAATRKYLRWAGEMKQSYKIVSLVFLDCIFGVGLVIGPFIWALGTDLGEMSRAFLAGVAGGSSAPEPFFHPADVVMYISASNAIDFLVASVFVLLAVLLLVHRVLWPLLNRSIFRFQEVGIKGRRAILVSVGLLLLGVGTGDKLVEHVKKISELFKG